MYTDFTMSRGVNVNHGTMKIRKRNFLTERKKARKEETSKGTRKDKRGYK